MNRPAPSLLILLMLGTWACFPRHPAAQTSAPAYTALPWIRTGGPIGGLGYDIRYNLAEPHVWYVTDAWAGIHMSTDNGMTWQPRTEGIDVVFGSTGDVIPIFCATVDPLRPNIVWIGTQYTGEIFTSTDAGHTWIRRDSGIDKSLVPLSFRGFTVHPHRPETVYAMAEIGSQGWTPDGEARIGQAMDLTQGIVYKTTDGGLHWEEIWRGDNLARYAWINPEHPDVLYVSTGIFDREAANTSVTDDEAGGVGILKSEDGGRTWRALNEDHGLTDLYISSLFMKPGSPDVLLAAGGSDPWHVHYDGNSSGVFLTEDGGEHWQRVLDGEGSLELFAAVEYCPSDPDIAYAASTDAVYRSEDGGHTWQRFDKGDNTWGPPGIIAGFPIDMQCDPRDPLRVFVNNYLGGNFLSEDGGRTWISASAGYTGAMVHHLAASPERPDVVYAGSRSGVFRSEDAGRTWTGLAYPPEDLPIRINEISALAVSPADPYRVLSAPADARTALYSEDGGRTWRHAPLTGTPASPVALVFSPSDPNIAYAAVTAPDCPTAGEFDPAACEVPGTGLYVSHDGGRTWHAPDGHAPLGRSISALAVSPVAPGTVYAVMPFKGLFRSQDGGRTWAPTGAGLPTDFLWALAIDPADPEHLFVAAGNGVYRTTDGGDSWTLSHTGLEPNARVQSLAIDPTDGAVVYAADLFSGVYVSTDDGRAWHRLNDGLDHRSAYVLSLADDGTVLYVGIEGAGVYRLGDPRTTGIAYAPEAPVHRFHLEQNYPNPFKPETTIHYRLNRAAHVRLQIFTLLGLEVATLVDEHMEPGSYTARWRGTDRNGLRVASGVYLYRLEADGFVASKSLLFVK